MKKKRKYIVTGGAGFVGSHVAAKLVADGHEVVILDDLSTGHLENIPESDSVTFVEVDISDWNSLSRTFNHFKGAEGIFHLAARARIQPSILNPLKTHKCNVDGTFNILEMMRMTGVNKIVYSASSSSYGLKASIPCTEDQAPDCLNPYALTKYVGEQYCKTWGKIYGIKNVCLKYFNVYGAGSPLVGPYAPVVGLFFRQALKDGGPLTIVGDGEQRRDFTHISDIVTANIAAMSHISSEEVNGETFNVGTGKNYSVNDIANFVCNSLVSLALSVDRKYIPARPAEARETLADISRTTEYLGWEPSVDLEEQIGKLVYYYNDVFSDE